LFAASIDVVRLDLVAVDNAAVRETLSNEVIGEVRAEGPGPAQDDAQVREPGENVRPAVQAFVMSARSHGVSFFVGTGFQPVQTHGQVGTRPHVQAAG
jgi:hypothetical protein